MHMTLTQKLNNEIARLRDELHNANLRADKAERQRNEAEARADILIKVLTDLQGKQTS